jgi:glycosyltransferase involved in cell wall biosynthesis
MRDGPMPDDFEWRTKAVARGLARADAVVAPSEAFAGVLARRYALQRPPEVIRNGTALAPRVDTPRERHALTAGRLWDEAKGAGDLDAVAGMVGFEIRAAGPRTGPGSGQFDPVNLVALDMLDQTDLAREYERAGVFVSLARYEPFGLAVLEAAATGCPLVLADIDTFRELWDDAALFVQPGDHAAVADAMTSVLDDDRLAERLSSAARTRAEAYPQDAVTAGYLRLYRRLLANAATFRVETHA